MYTRAHTHAYTYVHICKHMHVHTQTHTYIISPWCLLAMMQAGQVMSLPLLWIVHFVGQVENLEQVLNSRGWDASFVLKVRPLSDQEKDQLRASVLSANTSNITRTYTKYFLLRDMDGLRNSLDDQPDTQIYAVVDGNHRLAAMLQLASSKDSSWTFDSVVGDAAPMYHCPLWL
jgi:hypothetical protein